MEARGDAEAAAAPEVTASPRPGTASASDEDLFRRFDAICARREVGNGGTGGTGTPGGAEQDCALEAELPAGASAGVRQRLKAANSVPLDGLLDSPLHGAGAWGGALASTAPAGLVAGARQRDQEVQAWAAEWRRLGGKAGELELELAEEVLRRWRPSDWSSPGKRRNRLSDLRRELDESEAAFGRWRQDLWHGLGHLRKRVQAFVQNASRDVGLPEQLEAVGQSIDGELEDFKRQCSKDFGEAFVDDEGLCQELGGLCEHYDACIARPSAADPPEQGGAAAAEGGAAANPSGGEGEEAAEDAEVAEIRALLTELEGRAWSAGAAVEAWPMLQRQVVMRTLRIFKMQPTAAFFARVEQQLPQVPPERLSLLVKQLAELESCAAQKRLLVARWRRRQEALAEEDACFTAGAEAARLERRQQLERRQARQQAERRRSVGQWRHQRTEEELQAAALRQREACEQELAVERRRRRSHRAQQEVLRSHRWCQAEREAAARAATQRLEGAVRQENVLRERRQRLGRSADPLRRRPAEPQPPLLRAEAAAASPGAPPAGLPDGSSLVAEFEEPMPPAGRCGGGGGGAAAAPQALARPASAPSLARAGAAAKRGKAFADSRGLASAS